jgi:hypothetical protein
MSFIYVILSLLGLLFTKKKLTSEVSDFVRRLGGSQRAVIVIWSIFFLPGTIVHELSHFLTAALFGARTGKIEIFPEYLEEELEGNSSRVVLGSVQTQKLNPVQGFFVGTAPFITGLPLLIWLASLLVDSYQAKNTGILLLEGYFFFTIANSFFPSWSDIKQAVPFVIISLFFGLVAWYFGFQLLLSSESSLWIVFDSFWKAISLSVILNLVFIGIFYILLSILRKKR